MAGSSVVKDCRSRHQPIPHPRQPILYFQKNERGVSEINLNLVKYFRKCYSFYNGIYQPVQSIRAHLLQSMCCQTEGMLVQDEGPLMGHLPLLEDLVGCYDEGACVMLYWLLDRFYSSPSSLTVPPEIEEAIDLKPNLSTDSIVAYSFPTMWRHIFVGSFTDTLHLMTVDNTNTHLRFQVEGCTFEPRHNHRWPIRKRYNRVTYKGHHLSSATEEYGVLARGSHILIWNARGCTRPSFTENFAALHNKFNPMLFIILEARLGKHEANNLVVRSLPGDYEAEMCGPQSRPGGVMMCWQQHMLRANFFHISTEPDGVAVDAFFHVICLIYKL